uniref:Putative trichohyalin-plectin-similarity domain protein n=1 Tax=Lutzomyia longipalpis TaxID=7200 RepID=A0A1B0CEX5_LUTLO
MIYQNSTTGGNRELSLVEQKKRQWQKEREEMAKLGEFPIKIESRSSTYEKTSIRTFYASNMDLTENYRGRKNSMRHGGVYEGESRRIRSPSLPPIGRQKFQGGMGHSTTEDDTGYTSGSPQHSDSSGAEVWTNTEHPQKVSYAGNFLPPKPQLHITGSSFEAATTAAAKEAADDTFSEATTKSRGSQLHHKMSPDSLDLEHETEFSKSLSTPSSSSSDGQSFTSFQAPDFGGYHKVKEERAKWGDRGVTVGHLYDPIARVEMEKSARSVPVWLEKGLHEMRDSEDESVRSFIRGQNTPIDPQILEERANRRRKAMELQDAIKEQLKERERQRKWEKERRLREERLEEERMMRQMEMERARFEYDKRVQQEKLEKEKKKHDMMRRALAKAEMEAKVEKDRRKHKIFHREASPPPAREAKEAPEEASKEEKTVKSLSVEEDPERVLIGTPIKLKKQIIVEQEDKKEEQVVEDKTSMEKQSERQSEKQAEMSPPEKPLVVIDRNNRATDLDGIALVLQTMTPVVPLPIASDFLNFNATVNNLQLALLLAAQQQRPEKLNGGDPEKISMRESHNRECSYCCKVHGNNTTSTVKEEVKTHEEALEDGLVKTEGETEANCAKEEDVKQVEVKLPEQEEPPKLPHDGTFTKEDTLRAEMRIDAATCTRGDILGERMLTPRKYRHDSSSSVDVAVQTEIPSRLCNLCCHHKLYLQEISTVTTSVTQTSNKGQQQTIADDDGGSSARNETITTTTTTKTMIRSKAGKSKKPEPRPKWGVNRPLMQYIKASERDPFCLRQRRKKYQQRSFIVKPESPKNSAGTNRSISRNVCTEILPIKTDSNGRIFLNFHEASVMMKEDPVKQQNSAQARERIMSKRPTEENSDEGVSLKDNKDFSNLAIVKANSATRRQSSFEDVDTEECSSDLSSIKSRN